jgi:hypothetical protein
MVPAGVLTVADIRNDARLTSLYLARARTRATPTPAWQTPQKPHKRHMPDETTPTSKDAGTPPECPRLLRCGSDQVLRPACMLEWEPGP